MKRSAVAALLAVLTTACADRVAAPVWKDATIQVRDSSLIAGTLPPVEEARLVTKAYTCHVSRWSYTPQGTRVGAAPARQVVELPTARGDTVTQSLWLVHFASGTRRRTEDVRCELPANGASVAWVQEYIARNRRSTPSALSSPQLSRGMTSLSLGVGTYCWTFGSPDSGVTWLCDGGIECVRSAALRASSVRASPADGAASSLSGGGFGGTFGCSGGGSEGCYLVVTESEGWYEILYGGSCDAEGDGGVDSGGGGPPPNSPTPAQQIADLVELDPYALLDVPCSQIVKWASLAQLPIPPSVTTRLASEPALSDRWTSAKIQTLQSAKGPIVNMDYYAVTVPIANIPNGLSVNGYLNHVRTNINNYVDAPTRFNYYPGLTGEEQRWQGSTPLGTVFSISLQTVEDGSVVTTSYGAGQWTFSTIETKEDRTHPVSGNREFGAIDNGNGTATFYTRGTDRISTTFNRFVDWAVLSVYDRGGQVWEGMQNRLKTDLGASAVIEPRVIFRPEYSQVSAVLAGQAPVSTLACKP